LRNNFVFETSKRKKEPKPSLFHTFKKARARQLGKEVGMGFIGGSPELPCQFLEGHQYFLASSLKATSLSLPWMISLADLTWRKHSTIWSSRGS